MASEQATMGATAPISEGREPTTNLDITSKQAPVENTTETAQGGEPSTNLDMKSEQVPVGNTVKSSETGATRAEGGDKSTNPLPYDDEAFNTKVNDTEAHVAGAFQNAFSGLERPTADTTTQTSSSTQGKGGRAFKNRWDDDDTIENQMRNTTAQVVGTFKGLSTAFNQAGEKIRGRVKNKDSSEA